MVLWKAIDDLYHVREDNITPGHLHQVDDAPDVVSHVDTSRANPDALVFKDLVSNRNMPSNGHADLQEDGEEGVQGWSVC